jgi:hypothetical protein
MVRPPAWLADLESRDLWMTLLLGLPQIVIGLHGDPSLSGCAQQRFESDSHLDANARL